MSQSFWRANHMLPAAGLGATNVPRQLKQRAVNLARVARASPTDEQVDSSITDEQVDSSSNFTIDDDVSALDDDFLAHIVTEDLKNETDFLLSEPLNHYLSLFSPPELENRPWLSDGPHITLLLRIFTCNLSRFFLTTVLLAMIAVVDLWPVESLMAVRLALVAKCLSLPDDFFDDRYQRHLTLLFELALRQPGVRWTSESLQDFLPFTLRSLEASAIAVFPVIGAFLLTITNNTGISDPALPLLSEMASTFVGRIYEFGDFMPFLGVLLPLFKRFPFPDHELSSGLYGLFQKLVLVWFASDENEAYLFSGLELVEPLWSRGIIPLSLCDGALIEHVCALTGDGPSFRVRHAASVIVLEMMRDSLIEMVEGISPVSMLCLCFELFARMPFEATGVERLLAIRSFRTASAWYSIAVTQPPLSAILDAEQLELSFDEWEETADEDVAADLQELIQGYSELIPRISDSETRSEWST
jgi:hypothetical protein